MDDPLWHCARVALHFDGVEGATAAPDLKGNSWTAYGDAHITTSDGVFGGSCAVFDGAGDYFRSDAPIGSFVYEPWSISLWVRTAAAGVVLIDIDDTYFNYLYQVRINNGGRIEVWCQNSVLFAGTVSVNDGSWHHIVVGKTNDYTGQLYPAVYITVDGVLDSLLQGQPYLTPFPGTGARMAIGAQVRYRDAAKDFIGKIDDLVIHIGAQGFATDAFVLPPAPFGNTFGGLLPALVAVPLSAAVGGQMPAQSPSLLSGCRPLVDLENGGRGRVIGTTKNVGNPDYPVSRRVRLLRKRDGFLAREGWSDAGGNYLFEHVRHDIEYIVLSHDHTGVYNAVIADSVTPDLMP